MSCFFDFQDNDTPIVKLEDEINFSLLSFMSLLDNQLANDMCTYSIPNLDQLFRKHFAEAENVNQLSRVHLLKQPVRISFLPGPGQPSVKRDVPR